MQKLIGISTRQHKEVESLIAQHPTSRKLPFYSLRSSRWLALRLSSRPASVIPR
jgi:hypothetical protein